MKVLLTNGHVWQENGFAKLDILIEDGTIKALGENLTEPYAEAVDCKEAYILPAWLDMHVHVGEKVCGLDLADDWQSLSLLANRCGIAGIGAFITERQPTDKNKKPLAEQYNLASRTAEEQFRHAVHWHLTPTVSGVKDVYPLLEQGCDLKFYTTYRPHGLYRSYAEIAEWMQELKDLKPRLLVHCEDDELVDSMTGFNPFHHPFDHARRRPEMAEILAVERILDLAIQHSYPVHIVHVSSPQSALLIDEARRSVPVTCETAPHYLLLNETMLQREDGHRWLCTPPLRSEKSRGELTELLQDGLFDAIATDHCPFTKADKDRHKSTPEQVPTGIAGVGATFPLLYETLVKTGRLPLEKLVPLLTSQPARLMNLYPAFGSISAGSKASLIILQQEPLKNPQPILSSLRDTYNPWQDCCSTTNYYFFEAPYGKQ